MIKATGRTMSGPRPTIITLRSSPAATPATAPATCSITCLFGVGVNFLVVRFPSVIFRILFTQLASKLIHPGAILALGVVTLILGTTTHFAEEILS